MKIDDIDIAYNLVEMDYINKFKEILKLDNLSDYKIRKKIFPKEWQNIINKKQKLLILKEALEKQILISNTQLMNEYYQNHSTKLI